MRFYPSAFLTIPTLLMHSRRNPTLPSEMPVAHVFEDPEPLMPMPSPELQPTAPVCDTNKIMSRLREPTAEEMRIVMLAKRRAFAKLNEMMNKLSCGDSWTLQRAKLFFGNTVTAEGLLSGLKLIKRTLSMITADRNYVVDPIDDGCSIVAFALVPPSATLPNPYDFIFLRYLFFQSPRHRQGNILIHEASHLALNTDDIPMTDGNGAYGVERAVYLGVQEPASSVHNADNWALFVDTWPDRRPNGWCQVIK